MMTDSETAPAMPSMIAIWYSMDVSGEAPPSI